MIVSPLAPPVTFGLSFNDFYDREGLSRLDAVFVAWLKDANVDAHARLLAARAADPVPLARSPAAPDAGLAAAAEPLAAPSRFSEVRPGDWAYQALSQLVALDGCPAAAGRVGLDGGLPLSRYEAAALLQACLVTSGARTDLVRRLQLEFEQELAVLQGLADGLETRLGELQASQFAASTILWADARLWLGAVQYGGNQIDRARSTYSGQLLREALV